jgi:hypothetical protein
MPGVKKSQKIDPTILAAIIWVKNGYLNSTLLHYSIIPTFLLSTMPKLTVGFFIEKKAVKLYN